MLTYRQLVITNFVLINHFLLIPNHKQKSQTQTKNERRKY